MANVVINRFKTQSMAAGIDLTAAGTLRCALLTNIFGTSASSEIADIPAFSAISSAWEASGVGYAAGGSVLSATAVSEDDSGEKGIFSAANVTWGTATITAYGAFIYRESDSFPVCAIDFGGAKTSTAGDFTIQWNAAGIINLT
jgi:hypothetical protein